MLLQQRGALLADGFDIVVFVTGASDYMIVVVIII